jgi:hypothetical protein
MAKLSFLIGKWSGTANLARSPAPLAQTEEAQYKLDGLVLTIEGVGKSKDGERLIDAYGIVTYEDAARVYRFRAYNDGRWLETEATLLEDGVGLKWSFSLGPYKTNSTLRITEKGEWTELSELSRADTPGSTELMALAVHRVR